MSKDRNLKEYTYHDCFFYISSINYILEDSGKFHRVSRLNGYSPHIPIPSLNVVGWSCFFLVLYVGSVLVSEAHLGKIKIIGLGAVVLNDSDKSVVTPSGTSWEYLLNQMKWFYPSSSLMIPFSIAWWQK